MTCFSRPALLVRFVVPAIVLSILIGVLPRAAAAQSSAPPQGAPVIITPISAPGVTLQTHTSDITLSADGTAEATAFYRLRNEGTTDSVATLGFTSPTAGGAAALPADLAATVDGAPLQIQPGTVAQALVTVPAGGRTDLRLRYSFDLGSGAVLETRFDAAALEKAWPGSTSFRLTINVPAEIPGGSWLRTTPEGWRFSPSETAAAAAIQWLYRGQHPP